MVGTTIIKSPFSLPFYHGVANGAPSCGMTVKLPFIFGKNKGMIKLINNGT